MKNDAQLRASITPDLKRRLRVEALKQRRSDSSLVRLLLEDSLPHIPKGTEFEIELSKREAATLTRQGYCLKPILLSGTQLPLPLI